MIIPELVSTSWVKYPARISNLFNFMFLFKVLLIIFFQSMSIFFACICISTCAQDSRCKRYIAYKGHLSRLGYFFSSYVSILILSILQVWLQIRRQFVWWKRKLFRRFQQEWFKRIEILVLWMIFCEKYNSHTDVANRE